MRSSEEHARLYGTQGQPPRDPADEMDDAEQARVHRRPTGPIHADYCPKERGFTTCLCGGMNHYVTELEKEAMRLAVEVDKLRAELAAAKADINSLIDNYESANDNCNAAESALALSQERGERMRAALEPFAMAAAVIHIPRVSNPENLIIWERSSNHPDIHDVQVTAADLLRARAALAADAPGHRPPVGDAAKEGTK